MELVKDMTSKFSEDLVGNKVYLWHIKQALAQMTTSKLSFSRRSSTPIPRRNMNTRSED